jgi:hypothetical protein
MLNLEATYNNFNVVAICVSDNFTQKGVTAQGYG